MKREVMIYAINYKYLTKSFKEYTNKEFINLARENGRIFSLKDIENKFNSPIPYTIKEILPINPDVDFIRII